LIQLLTQSAIGAVQTRDTIGRATGTGNNGSIEIVILSGTLITDTEIITEETVDLTGLATLPRKGKIEGPNGTLEITVLLVVVVPTTIQTLSVVRTPTQTSHLRRINVTRQTQQRITRIEIHTSTIHQSVHVQTDQTISSGRYADVTTNFTGQADSILF
jgi:hypothetical protein